MDGRGDYLVIYRIDDHRRTVDVVAIEHRSDICRPRQLWAPPGRRHAPGALIARRGLARAWPQRSAPRRSAVSSIGGR